MTLARPDAATVRRMPDNSLDWQWFRMKQMSREALVHRGVCVAGCRRPAIKGRVVCATCPVRHPQAHKEAQVCAYCGTQPSAGGQLCGSVTQASYPLRIEHCRKCHIQSQVDLRSLTLGRVLKTPVRPGE